MAQLGQIGLVFVIGMYLSVHPAVLVESTPLPVRYTAVALGYNACLAVTGGTTPLVAHQARQSHS